MRRFYLSFANFTSYFTISKIRDEIVRLRLWKSWRSSWIRELLDWSRTVWPIEARFQILDMLETILFLPKAFMDQLSPQLSRRGVLLSRNDEAVLLIVNK
ncbi:hypothetical protein OUZ56_033284 [Daphnia magna]|uniref:Uncharacterized protein n=1 Tax=Daphnia magna TaxID=35525 RepID=A0ABR0BAJ8_9CRUS|nr:hypothetical protein OUZ56_033284 [Daphnia magna]